MPGTKYLGQVEIPATLIRRNPAPHPHRLPSKPLTPPRITPEQKTDHHPVPHADTAQSLPGNAHVIISYEETWLGTSFNTARKTGPRGFAGKPHRQSPAARTAFANARFRLLAANGNRRGARRAKTGQSRLAMRKRGCYANPRWIPAQTGLRPASWKSVPLGARAMWGGFGQGRCSMVIGVPARPTSLVWGLRRWVLRRCPTCWPSAWSRPLLASTTSGCAAALRMGAGFIPRRACTRGGWRWRGDCCCWPISSSRPR